MWDKLIAQNGIGGEAIVWLIIAFFWVVAQLFSRAKEKAQRRAMSEAPPTDESGTESGLDQEMRKFFEAIGAEVVEEERPAIPAPRRRPQRPGARREPRPLPPPIHLAERPAPALDILREPVDPHLGEMDTRIDESALDTERAYALPEEHGPESMNAFVNPRTLLVNLNYLRMNMPLIPVSGLDTTNEARPRPTFHGRKALRDALTTQIILSNPLAMGEDKASYTKRVV